MGCMCFDALCKTCLQDYNYFKLSNNVCKYKYIKFINLKSNIKVHPLIVGYNSQKHKKEWDNKHNYTKILTAISNISYNKETIFWCEFSNSARDQTAHCCLLMFANNTLYLYEPLNSLFAEYNNQKKKNLPEEIKPLGLSKMINLIIKTRVKVPFSIENIIVRGQANNENNCRLHCAFKLNEWSRSSKFTNK